VAKRAIGLSLLGSRKSNRSSGFRLNLSPMRLCSPQTFLRDHFAQWGVGVFFPFLGRLGQNRRLDPVCLVHVDLRRCGWQVRILMVAIRSVAELLLKGNALTGSMRSLTVNVPAILLQA